MKSLIIAPAIAVCVFSSNTYGQKKAPVQKEVIKSEETIVIKKKKGEDKTVIEINDGRVLINGEEVSTSAIDNGRKKIIIKDGNTTRIDEDADWSFAAPKGAMLGVYTKQDENTDGAIVERVMPNSAAAEAGLKDGDIITSVNGNKINSGKALTETIAKHDAGENIDVTYVRDGKPQTTKVTLSKAEAITTRIYKQPRIDDINIMTRPFMFEASDGAMNSSPKMGVIAEDYNDGNGVKVLEVKPNSAAAKAGLKTGDIITRLNDEKVVSVDDLQMIVLSSKHNSKLPLAYIRDGKENTTNVILTKPLKKKEL